MTLLYCEGFPLGDADAKRVIKAARGLSQAAEDDCNSPKETPAQRLREENQKLLDEFVKAKKIPKIQVTGDPRGYIVRFMLPSGRYNTWGGKEAGWGIA